MKTITVILPDHLNAALEQAAGSRRLSKSAMVLELLHLHLVGPEPSPLPERPSLDDQLAKYQVAGRTCVTDLASNPRHLSDYGR